MEDSRAYDSFIDHELAQEDSQIVEKDRRDRRSGAQLDASHVLVQSMSLSESNIVSIRNTSIYQDFLFSHLSGVAGPNQGSEEDPHVLMEEHSLANIFLARPPQWPQPIFEEASESPRSTHRGPANPRLQ